jgi:hypothetical protein
MTEQDWLSCGKPDVMLRHLQRPWPFPALKRPLRLFVCACCRLMEDRLTDPAARLALQVAEQYADGQASREQMNAARLALHNPHRPRWDTEPFLAVLAASPDKRLQDSAQQAAALVRLQTRAALGPQADLWPSSEWQRFNARFRPEVCALIREIFGNPFRRPTVEPRWLGWNDGTVTRLAQGIYEERAFDCLPILADALEEAGYPNADVIGHLRGPGPHVRGCWAVDLLAAKERQ